eukprot:3144168-Ditylum_brightwellii.AAC.1
MRLLILGNGDCAITLGSGALYIEGNCQAGGVKCTLRSSALAVSTLTHAPIEGTKNIYISCQIGINSSCAEKIKSNICLFNQVIPFLDKKQGM